MSIPKDKQLHFIGGAIICAVVSVLFNNIILGMSACVIAGAAKEAWDWFHPKTHTCEFLDFVTTALGGVIVLIIYLIVSGV